MIFKWYIYKLYKLYIKNIYKLYIKSVNIETELILKKLYFLRKYLRFALSLKENVLACEEMQDHAFLSLGKFGMVGRGYVLNVGRGYVINVGRGYVIHNH